jgi:hypothetical protein
VPYCWLTVVVVAVLVEQKDEIDNRKEQEAERGRPPKVGRLPKGPGWLVGGQLVMVVVAGGLCILAQHRWHQSCS